MFAVVCCLIASGSVEVAVVRFVCWMLLDVVTPTADCRRRLTAKDAEREMLQHRR